MPGGDRFAHAAALAAAIHLAGWLGACAPSGSRSAAEDAQRPVRVAAASSLSNVLPGLLRRWSRRSGVPTRLALDATSRLARQIEAGAPFDLLLSADRAWPRRLAERGRLEPGSLRPLGHNEIVLVVPAGASCAPFEHPAEPLRRLERVAAADPEVPAGRAADRALRALGLLDALGPRLVRAPHVRGVLAWVAGGEVDGGFVYRTDALAEPAVRLLATLPEEASAELELTAALVARPGRHGRAEALLRWLAGREGREALRAAGWR